jgi:signal transduction histidine kinase
VHTKPDPRFLSITAHDLRGAVGVIDGAMKELLREVSKDNADAAKLTQMMGRSTQRLLLLGDRLSSLAKLMASSELELQENVDLSAMVKEAANRAFSAHARRNLRLQVEGTQTPVAVHAQSFAAAVAELTALFCSFSQAELKVTVARDADGVRVKFESDNKGESVQRALRDREAATLASAGINFAEAVLGRHHGTVELSENDGSNAAVSLVLRGQS